MATTDVAGKFPYATQTGAVPQSTVLSQSPAIATDIEECLTFIVGNSMHFPQLDLFIFAVKAYAHCVTKNMTEGAPVKQ